MVKPARPIRLASALLIPVLWFAEPRIAGALQVVEATDGVTVEAVLAIKEPTRIRIDGASITNVFGNIYSSNCGAAVSTQPGTGSTPVLPQTNPAGEIVLECDADKGEIYVRPIGGSGGLGKPVNLFISSAHATYTLVLRKADTPADTIVIRDPGQRALQAMQSPPSAAGSQMKPLTQRPSASSSEPMPSGGPTWAISLPNWRCGISQTSTSIATPSSATRTSPGLAGVVLASAYRR